MYKNQYREKSYVEEILEKGFTSKHLLHEIKLLAKFYKEEGHDEEKRKELVYTFCENNIEKFNKVTYFKTINKALNYVANKDEVLTEIDNINISKSELDYIEELDIDDNLKKLIFTLLTVTKLNKKYLSIRDGELKSKEYYFGGYSSYRDLVACSKIMFDKKKGLKNIHDLIRILGDNKMVEIVGKGNIKLSFMYETEDDESNGILIENFNVIGYYYDLFILKNTKLKQCESCKTIVKLPNAKTANATKYCKDCALKKERERVRKLRKLNQ